METTELLFDGFARVAEVVHDVLDGIDPAQLTFRADADANTIAWLIWHLARVQDDHVAGAVGRRQVWVDGWSERFGLPFDASAIGYGHGSRDVAEVRADAGLLGGYFDAVHERTREILGGVGAADLDRVVDENWDPPVTMAARLVSVVSDDLQHAGQAAFVRGLAERA